MSAPAKRVVYVRFLAHLCYAQMLAERADLCLDRIDLDTEAALAGRTLAQAHAYQIASARDDVAPGYIADADLLRRTPALLVVSTNGAGFDTVDVDACTDAGVLVVNQAGGNREAVAEHVLGMMLCLAKRIPEVDRALRRDRHVDRLDFMGHDMLGKTIGIVGLGHVGSRVSQLCGGLLSMRVLAYDPYLTAEEIAARGAHKVELGELLQASDVVSINCPLTEDTRGMIGAREFSLMPSHAIFITTARGHIHDETALAAALADKRLAGAGLDVWVKEPPPRAHPLLAFDNVLVSTHTAGVTHEARANIARIAAIQLIDTLDGKRPPRIVNPQVWPRYSERFTHAFGFAPEGAALAAE